MSVVMHLCAERDDAYFYKDSEGVCNWLFLQYVMLRQQYGMFRLIGELNVHFLSASN